MKNIVFLSASPKAEEESATGLLVEMAGDRIEDGVAVKTFIDVRQSFKKHSTLEDFEKMSKADALVIAFPLYVFCMPGILTRFLQDYYQYIMESGKSSGRLKVYAIVNCGFPEPGINIEAVRVIRSFSSHIGARFRFGILIGGGGILVGQKGKSVMKKTVRKLNNAFTEIATDISSELPTAVENIHIDTGISRFLYLFIGNLSWPWLARKNGLKKKDMYRQPYL
jgi:multimeric flavodoxin WrbA